MPECFATKWQNHLQYGAIMCLCSNDAVKWWNWLYFGVCIFTSLQRKCIKEQWKNQIWRCIINSNRYGKMETCVLMAIRWYHTVWLIGILLFLCGFFVDMWGWMPYNNRRINRKQHKPKFQTGLHHSAAGKRKDDTKVWRPKLFVSMAKWIWDWKKSTCPRLAPMMFR